MILIEGKPGYVKRLLRSQTRKVKYGRIEIERRASETRIRHMKRINRTANRCK